MNHLKDQKYKNDHTNMEFLKTSYIVLTEF